MPTEPASKDPLHGVTLERMLTELSAHYGWEEMGRQIPIRCFTANPSLKSSLTFLRKTPWARARVEAMYRGWSMDRGHASTTTAKQPHTPADATPMPVLFVGHGTPMNALEDNAFSREWRRVAAALPAARAILCISAHWETSGTRVTGMGKPETIHDFGGFPRALFEVQYPAAGSPWLARETLSVMKRTPVELDTDRGLDHGCWSVLRQMFPTASIPVVQLSLDANRPTDEHYALARELAPLRHQGVLILASGNLVHNLGLMEIRGQGPEAINQPFGFDWALEANALFKRLIGENRHAELANYLSLGAAVRLAVPTPEHYLPLLYALALKQDQESVALFNDQAVAGSLTMTSLIISGCNAAP